MYKKTGGGFALTAVILGLAIWAIDQIKPQLGIDLQGGVELTYQLPEIERTYTGGTLAETVKRIISNRLNRFGVKEIVIATQGSDRIIVQVPGADNADEIIKQIEEAGNIEFMLVAPPGLEGTLATLRPAVDKYNREIRAWVNGGKKGPAPSRPEALQKVYTEKEVYLEALKAYEALPPEEQLRTDPPKAPEWVVYPRVLERTTEAGGDAESFEVDPGSYTILHYDPKYRVSGEHLTGAREVLDERQNPAIGFEFDGQGGAKFGEITGNHKDRDLAIQLDGNLISVARIESKITTQGRITGGLNGFTHKQVEGVVNLLLGGSLPSKPQLVSKTEVGSTLSEDSIKRGLTSVIYGLAIVLVFMLFYYLVGGIVANLAVILNLIFIFAYVLVFRQTLTLPGIAGVILTIGMAVDANILIFERVREELLKGKSLAAALGTGYQRAFWVIFDSNVTTLATGIVLVQFGTGPVKGFAVTLIAGIMASFFTSVFVTRLILSFLININVLKSFKMLRLIGIPRVDFQQRKKAFLALSLVTIVCSWGLVVARGRENYGVDFNGGTKLIVRLARPISQMELEDLIEEKRLASEELKNLFSAVAIQTVRLEQDEGHEGKASSFSILVRSRTPKRAEGEVSAQAPPGDTPAGNAVQAVGAESADESGTSISPEQRTRERVQKVLGEIFAEQGLDLAPAFVQRDGLHEWVDAPRVPGGTITPGERGLRLRVNLIRDASGKYLDFPDKSKSDEENLTEFLNAHLAQRFSGRITDDFQGIVVLGVMAPDPAAGRSYFQIDFSGYRAPDADADASAGPPSRRAVEQAVTDFFKGRAAVLQNVNATGARILDLSEPFPEVVTIGSRVASNLQRQALIAFFIAIVAIIFYLSLRFEFVFGLAAICALVHDVLISIGILALTDTFFGEYLSLKINLPEVAALLTIVGYSVNDTIVVFDRIRENLRLARKNVEFEDLVNMSINQTLARTVWTSVTTLIVILMLLAAGGDSIKGFAFTFAIGLVTGTYSSVFVASPVLVYLRKRAIARRERLKLEAAAA